jgi:methylenetetrahydrofolate dehydrogenase (NADP+) / methenyltetrahydrofolate cyclohydrolase
MAQILDGKWVRDQILESLRPRVEKLKSSGRAPGLAVVLVGHDPGSEIYVRNKVKACGELGIYSEKITPSESIGTVELRKIVEDLNRREEVDGVLVQMPLPRQVNSREVLLAIDPAKDVDGFHPFNVGSLVANAPGPRACTPAGVMEMLRMYDISPFAKRVVIVGRSDIVGKPMAMMMLHQHATVTICHSKTPDLAGVCRQADILVGAIGRPAFLTAEFIREGAVVVDVGINRLSDRAEVARIFRNDAKKLAQFDSRGNVLVGDFDPIDAPARATAYTPVPGGVGLLTIAMLMSNTVMLAERRLSGCYVSA